VHISAQYWCSLSPPRFLFVPPSILLLSTGAVFGVGLIDRDLEIYSLSRLLIMGVERVGTTAEGIVADDGRALAGGDQWSA